MVLRSNGELSEEITVYEKMDSLLKDLVSTSFIKTLDSFSLGVDGLTEQVSTLVLDDKNVKSEKVAKRTTRGRKPAAKTTVKVPTKAKARTAQKSTDIIAAPVTEIAEECSSLITLRADVGRRKVLTLLVQDKLSQAIDFLDQLQDIGKSLERNILHLWVSYKAMLLKSMKELSSDFTFNTLPESTIAFPAIGQNGHTSSQGVPVTKPLSTTGARTKSTKKAKITKEHFVATLREARERLVESHGLCAQAGSSSNFQQASYALAQVTILLSAMSNVDVQDSLNPLYAAYMSEVPKINNLRLNQESIAVEQESMSREECLKWPEPNASKRATLAVTSDFQKEYIDIIPKTWTAISIALNEAHDELYITRYEFGVTPFALRIPLTRHASRDMDEDEFSFDDGKRDFEEIIELSDFSTKTAKDMTSKEARLQWWTERESLDTRLHGLLLNIENVWLGGFKGIFSQHTRQPALLTRFRKCFENILDRHLPSRRGKAVGQNSALDSRVLELFIGLGDVTNDELDLDEALMDLMYFVVDIFQFNGETNAYDEIDFDSMVVDALDALRAYHTASKNVTATSPHTILILDKTLHLFPWESLPCLQSNSISRLPSLAALRERLLAARKSSAIQDGAAPGHYIPASAGGTSILNPSGDLVHTTKTIKPRLDSVAGSWTHIVNHVPSEKEFESALKDKDLVLYFGHGSGAQFVRSKSVRRLFPGTDMVCEKPGCATTFLFGCSSAHLTENGIYEPSGMLSSYLVAGAPAVVGMLWDVTDKDCDRFAVKCGELWGLWPEVRDEAVLPKTPGKKAKGKGKVAQLVAEVENARGTGTVRAKKGKSKAGDEGEVMDGVDQQRKRGVGLDEAVRDAREACVLRYLNGAAAVVYGIPVYLE
jgi:separase